MTIDLDTSSVYHNQASIQHIPKKEHSNNGIKRA